MIQRDWIEEAAIQNCKHKYGIHTNAFVPGGFYCSSCDQVIWRDMPPPPNEPEIIGYKTAVWVWHYEEGRPWTDDFETP